MSTDLTKDLRETTCTRIQQDHDFAVGLLDESLVSLLNGEPEVARLLLRDLVHATVGFEQLANITGKHSKSLHRMLSVQGNPTMDNLIAILHILREQLNVDIKVKVVSCV